MSIRLTQLASTVLTLCTLASICGAQTVQIGSNLESGDVPEYRVSVPSILPRGATRVSLGPQPLSVGRLRCWQHGVAVVDEPLADATLTAGTSMISALSGDGQQLTVVTAGAGLCLATLGRIRSIHRLDRDAR